MVDLKKIVEEYDIRFLVDRSRSMMMRDVPAKRGFLGFGGSDISRWEAAGREIAGFVKEVEQIDTDGLDITFFGYQITSYTSQTSAQILSLFDRYSPDGSTPLAEGLIESFRLGKASKKSKQFIFVYTDGTPDSKQGVRNAIIDQANSQQRDDEMTILFVQLGSDRGATAFLRELDDDLKGAKFDIVDAKTADEAKAFGSVAELIAHAIND